MSLPQCFLFSLFILLNVSLTISSHSEGKQHGMHCMSSGPDSLIPKKFCRAGTLLLSTPALGFMSLATQTTMDLGNSYISGTLVPELSELQHLKYLELYNNNLQGQIPVELGNLKNLISMNLYGNALEGELPSSFSKLNSLKFLRLNNNKLVGSIPRALSALSNLTFLDVSNNNLCGTIPVDGPFENFPVQSFENNSRLSGPELQGLVPYDLGC